MAHYRFDEVKPVRLSGARDVLDYLSGELVNPSRQLGFRGHRDAGWKLEPTLTRLVDHIGRYAHRDYLDSDDLPEVVSDRLLRLFRENIIVNEDVSEDKLSRLDLWQFGQHFGLPSPLLDWTRSPYVALFFAIADEPGEEEDCEQLERCLWVLDLDIIEHINDQVIPEIWQRVGDGKDPDPALCRQVPRMELVGELNQSNKRMAFQQGFFTKHIYHRSLEAWLQKICVEAPYCVMDRSVLEKVTFSLSESDRTWLLDVLDRMNINFRSLFPDIYGSAKGALEAVLRSFKEPRLKKITFVHPETSTAERENRPETRRP